MQKNADCKILKKTQKKLCAILKKILNFAKTNNWQLKLNVSL